MTQTQFNFFPTHMFWKFPAVNAKEFISAVNKCSENEIDNTTFKWGSDCVIDRIPLKWEDWMQLMSPNLEYLSKDIGKSFKFIMYDPWISYYKRGHYQEMHDHMMQDLACVFFANSGEGFSRFIFSDRYNVTLNTPIKQLIGYKNVLNVDYAAGDIIFFPGHQLHHVTSHESDVVRKTFACNLAIDVV
ncbi:hypothetical protein Syn7803C99_21 [Synechococcus phage ACG-2014a]|jgi:hypothetical protein|uniref:Uncharacterized protein n=1 Tax=Synechococcus phage ACG-2014a TaxID=1493507 RepID=A0A0E3FUF8_9CAUD|nr:hypothetical protein Syn7803C42_21 [Synechococcus phage ACG-2014a]AIX15070.1 hypothetical protein Syn7803C47_21 [Synechococcus phage ACG-2014a]AIX15718.1 hypothetical protein Syn7803C53_21 [Synechococcus phage ACG-2014a]AIX16828.1 hypothetical protein Syn7803C59_21 [Synechococcus phage ACG-2014a]AIX17037.1 hypothetical protein Syn7803C60_21 [Synechococcus phage ACG-2014a]